MRDDISAAFQAHLDSGSSSICYCTKLTRADGVIMTFASHDADVTFDGDTYLAKTGFTATKAETELGLTVPNLDIMGALRSDAITELDIAVGKYNDAKIVVWLVNFRDTAQRIISFKGTMGNVERGSLAFVAEMRGISEPLSKSGGRVFSKYSPVDLNLPISSGLVSKVISRRVFEVTGLSPNEQAIYKNGDFKFTSGANLDNEQRVKKHTVYAGVTTIELWRPAPLAVTIGDGFDVAQGDDGTAESYHRRYGNLDDWRGFNKLPSKDVLAYKDPRKLPA